MKASVKKILIIILVFSLGCTLGYVVSQRNISAQLQQTNTALNVDKLTEVFNLVVNNHVSSDIDTEKMSVDAIKGMLKSIDGGLTRYQTTEEYAKTSETSIRGDYTGIGVVIVSVEEHIIVVSPYKNTPADQAGLRPGDEIIAVNGASIKGLSSAELADLVRGPIGTDVTITIIPFEKEEGVDLTITREVIEIPVVNEELIGEDHNIGHVNLYTFNDHSAEQLQKALKSVIDGGAEYLILDLRGNPGGNLNACLDVADLFLKPNQPIFTIYDRDGQDVSFSTHTNAFTTLPMVVLIDKGSASASEVITGTLKDNQRATIIGTQSFGKASMQTGFPMEEGDLVWITTNVYRTPSGANIDKIGIEPHVALPEDILNLPAEEMDEGILNFTMEWIKNNLGQ